jgi:hypothetical protein
MASSATSVHFFSELAAFLAARPSREQLLKYQPSKKVQRQVRELLQKQNDGDLALEEKEQLDEFAHFERLFRLIKARLRSTKSANE